MRKCNRAYDAKIHEAFSHNQKNKTQLIITVIAY